MIVQQCLLVKALDTVKKSVSPRATLEVLKYVNLYADGNELLVRGTDLETFTSSSIACRDSDRENVCVYFPKFRDAILALDDETLELKVTDGKLKVTQNTTELDFLTLPGEEFPLAPVVDTEDSIVLDASDVSLAFSRVVHAAATDEGRPTLTGVYTSLADGILTTVCADGFRMAVSNVKVKANSTLKALVPKQSIDIVLGALSEGDVEIHFGSARLGFALPEKDGVTTDVYCQTIEGSYVNYQQIIPANGAAPIRVEKDDLVSALKLGKVFASANVIRHSVEENVIRLHSSAIESGDFKRSVLCSYKGEPVEYGVNYSYELEALAALDGEVIIECSSPNRPIYVYKEGQREEYLCVLMPMHIRK